MGEYDAGNIFAKIIDGDIPCFKVFETEHALAFLDAFPVAPGHALLVPKAKKYRTIGEMPPQAAADFLAALPRLARVVQAAAGADGVDVAGSREGCGLVHEQLSQIPLLCMVGICSAALGLVRHCMRRERHQRHLLHRDDATGGLVSAAQHHAVWPAAQGALYLEVLHTHQQNKNNN